MPHPVVPTRLLLDIATNDRGAAVHISAPPSCREAGPGRPRRRAKQALPRLGRASAAPIEAPSWFDIRWSLRARPPSHPGLPNCYGLLCAAGGSRRRPHSLLRSGGDPAASGPQVRPARGCQGHLSSAWPNIRLAPARAWGCPPGPGGLSEAWPAREAVYAGKGGARAGRAGGGVPGAEGEGAGPPSQARRAGSLAGLPSRAGLLAPARSTLPDARASMPSQGSGCQRCQLRVPSAVFFTS